MKKFYKEELPVRKDSSKSSKLMLFLTFLFKLAPEDELDMGGFLATDSFCFFKLLFPIKASRSSVGSSSNVKPYMIRNKIILGPLTLIQYLGKIN